MFVELHILQSFAPSNLNRDDTGNPKDTEFGGVRRARISSQCIKRSIRNNPVFAQTTQVDNALRTRWITRLLVKPLMNAGKPEGAAQSIAAAYATQYSKMNKGHTSVLLYLSNGEIHEAVRSLLQDWDLIIADLKDGKSPAVENLAKNMFKELKNRTGAPDIAMFGRMLAEKPDLNIDAACQVSHSISTHRVNMEMDYYTAVDDLSTDEETGAGMIGVIPFVSACFYRYARIDLEQLVKNLGGDKVLAKKTIEGFLRSAITAIPTGKQNSFAAQNPPDFILGVVRTDGSAWSLANAFENPVKSNRDGGYMDTSIAALDTYWGQLSKVYGTYGVWSAALVLNEDAPLKNLKQALTDNRENWIQSLLNQVE